MPWRRRCECGIGWYPCPDAPEVAAAVARSLRLDNRPGWDAPTTRLPNVLPRENPSLLTPGQAWRTRAGGRWDPLPPAGRS